LETNQPSNQKNASRPVCNAISRSPELAADPGCGPPHG
jgi:hypothetical protein